jgi:catechol 2,3-dioxygenase-like lactoylglutathione lyase family enzyme
MAGPQGEAYDHESMQLDHMILPVRDADESIEFYRSVLGCDYDGVDGPFSVMRVTPDFVLLLAPWGTDGGTHLAFAFSKPEFDAAFTRVRDRGIAYGDGPHEADNMKGPGIESGAHGEGAALYFFDPNQHLIEIRTYEA